MRLRRNGSGGAEVDDTDDERCCGSATTAPVRRTLAQSTSSHTHCSCWLRRTIRATVLSTNGIGAFDFISRKLMRLEGGKPSCRLHGVLGCQHCQFPRKFAERLRERAARVVDTFLDPHPRRQNSVEHWRTSRTVMLERFTHVTDFVEAQRSPRQPTSVGQDPRSA